jgi:hypothetical protein
MSGDIIERVYLDCICYIYPDMDAAEKGAKAGGGGLIVATLDRWKEDGFEMGFHHFYAVTNNHVLLQDRKRRTYYDAPVIRLNTNDGTEKIPTNQRNWQKWVDEDIAICGFANDALSERIKFSAIVAPDDFVDERSFEEKEIFGFGVGDDVFMAGRLVGHDGKKLNYPSVRSGTLSALPHAETHGEFLLEFHSIGGYSGSPVFIGWGAGSRRRGGAVMQKPSKIFFLGLNRCHIYNHEPLRDADTNEIVTPKKYVQVNTGIASAIPAWKILECLNDPELRAEREKAVEEFKAKRKEAMEHRQMDSADAEQPMTKAAFENALNKATRKANERSGDKGA